MKNLVIDLLIKMAKTDVQTKELRAQVEAQPLLLAALVLTVGKGIPASMSSNIQKEILSAPEASAEILSSDADLLLAHFDRLISVSHFVEENADSNLAHQLVAPSTPRRRGEVPHWGRAAPRRARPPRW